MTTPFDPNTIVPEPNPWFSCSVRYEGEAQAEYDDPRGTILGRGEVEFNESGRSHIQFIVEDIESESDLPFGLNQLLSREKPVQKDGKLVLSCSLDNVCSRLRIAMPHGEFFSTGNVFCTSHRVSSNPEEKERLSFLATTSQYEPLQAGHATYWAVPLLNFDSDFCQQDPSLDRHPLRIYPTPAIPEQLSGSDRLVAWSRANQRNRLIIFQFSGGLGFIEPLPDYEERLNRLGEGIDRHRVTAVMVGEIGNRPCGSLEELDSWFPFRFIDLLGLATGGPVGFLWIELRDDQGNLVRRFHAGFPCPVFRKGHRAIHEVIHRGTGRLLTLAQSSQYFNSTPLRVAMKHLLQGCYTSDLTLDEKISHICQGLDNLCIMLSLKSVRAEDAISCDCSQLVEKVKAITADAVKAIRRLSAQAKSAGHEADAQTLDKIARKVSGAKDLTVPFGQAVVRLLKQFGLHDAEILEKHFEAHPRPDKEKWQDLLSDYRGISIHAGAFQTKTGKHSHWDLAIFVRHLQDVLLRIILKMLGYDGTYQPTVWEWPGQAGLDWVAENTPACRLGYGKAEEDSRHSPVHIEISRPAKGDEAAP